MTIERNSLAVEKIWSIELAKDAFFWESNHRQRYSRDGDRCDFEAKNTVQNIWQVGAFWEGTEKLPDLQKWRGNDDHRKSGRRFQSHLAGGSSPEVCETAVLTRVDADGILANR